MKTLPLLCVGVLTGVAAAAYLPGPGLACLIWALGAWIGSRGPGFALTALLALLPVASFAPWTGSIFVEEFDLLLLGAVAVLLWRAPGGRAVNLPGHGWVVLWWLSVLIAAARGLAAGGLDFELSALATLHTGWNALRLAKPVLLAALLVAALRDTSADFELRLPEYFMRGQALGLALACGVCLWERAAFPGLGNFSADYRITGPFWEMHVGGAALDAYLALGVPAAGWLLWRAKSWRDSLIAAALFGLASYVVFATFSRATQLAYALMLAVWVIGWVVHSVSVSTQRMVLVGVGLVLAVGILLAVFDGGGYRTLAAVGVVALMAAWLAARALPERGRRPAWLPLAHPLVWGLAVANDKSAYVAFALGLMLWAGAVMLNAPLGVVWLCVLWQAGFAVWVAYHWGGWPAVAPAAVAVSGALAVAWGCAWRARTQGPLFDWSARLALGVGSCLMLASLMAILGHSAFMGERVTSTSRDAQARLGHWADGWAMWRSGSPAERVFGRGLGRYPALAHAHDSAQAGTLTHQFLREGDDFFLRLNPPTRERAVGDVLRVSQSRIRLPREPVVLSLSARSTTDTSVLVALCYKHLLYAESCEQARIVVGDTGGAWRPLFKLIDLSRLSPGPWFAPRDAMISFALPQGQVDVSELSIRGANNANLIANGDFSRGPARWFFTSDHDHLPWHSKQIVLGVLIEAGVVGVMMMAVLALLVCVRLARQAGPASPHALFWLSGLLALGLVGTVDTVLDSPRIAFLLTLFLLTSLRGAGVALPSMRARAFS